MAHGAPPTLVETIRRKLESAFAPQALFIADDSAHHTGHREASGRFHLTVHIVSERFEGMGSVQRHRVVYDALAEELAGPVHALRVRAQAPAELATDD